jgi:hypothetical protein
MFALPKHCEGVNVWKIDANATIITDVLPRLLEGSLSVHHQRRCISVANHRHVRHDGVQGNRARVWLSRLIPHQDQRAGGTACGLLIDPDRGAAIDPSGWGVATPGRSLAL